MALTIVYDGYGVIANADSETNDTGGTGTGDWKELGGGTIGLTPDVYLYSGASPDPASLGSKYASKAGYSYIDGGKSVNLGSGGSEDGELIWMWIFIAAAGAFDTLANYGFAAVAGNTVATGRAGNNYQWRIASGSDSNGWTGGWKLFVLDPNNTGTSVGSPSLTGVDTFGVWIETAVSVRADSIFQSQIMSAKGLIITGTTTSNAWTEIANWCTDFANRAAGMIQVRGSTLFCTGSFTVGNGSATTTHVASGNNIEFEACEYWNGTAWVSTMGATVNNIVTTAAASIDWTNVSVTGVTDNKLSLDTSLGNASSFIGGALRILRAIAVKSTDVFNGVVFTLNDALSLGTASYDNCSFNLCGTQTISSTVSSFTNNTFNPATGTTALETSDLEAAYECIFNSGGTGHAIELTSLGDGSLTWTGVTTGYDTGPTPASPITPTNTGDETIWVNVGSGTVTLNIATGATIPSVRSAGATVNIVAGAVNIDVNVKDQSETNVNLALVYIDEDLDTVGSITNTTTDSNGDITTSSYSGAATTATLRVRKYGFKPFVGTINLLADSSTNVILVTDPQQT